MEDVGEMKMRGEGGGRGGSWRCEEMKVGFGCRGRSESREKDGEVVL